MSKLLAQTRAIRDFTFLKIERYLPNLPSEGQ